MLLKVLVIDDSILFRRMLTDAVTATGEAEVVATALSGQNGIDKIKELKPDLITLDIEMPGLSGLEVLDLIKEQKLNCGVIIVSALTKRGGRMTMQAIAKGAFDFVTKPDGDSIDENRKCLIESLTPLLKAFKRKFEIRSILSATGNRPAAQPVNSEIINSCQKGEDLTRINERMVRLQNAGRVELVLIGVSTGGPNALAVVLESLPGNLGVPILIVQHMPPHFTQPLAESLNARCRLRVKEAENGELLVNDSIYIAPGGRQMRLKVCGNGVRTVEITDDPPENNCRPAVDYLFRSVAHQIGGGTMAVIMTGMGNDGLQGVKLLKRHNCPVITQDELSCVVYGMPRAVFEAGLSDFALPLDAIAAKIVSLVRGSLS